MKILIQNKIYKIWCTFRSAFKEGNMLQVTHKEFPCPKCHAMTNVIKPELPLDKWAETLPANTMMEALLESISLQVGSEK